MRLAVAISTLLALVALLVAVSSAGAALSPVLTRFATVGTDAGQLSLGGTSGGGLATDPLSGHVFVAEPGNNRVSEFTAWGEFVKAWGWGVEDGSPEAQTCTEATGCQQGETGEAAGQLTRPSGIAVGPEGNIYVFEGDANTISVTDNQRVQVFAPSGEFLRMFGGGVNHTSGADVCTAADLEGGDTCGAGSTGTGPAEFSATPGYLMSGDYIDIAPDGTVYVADTGRIQEFETSGAFKAELSFAAIHATEPAFPENRPPGALAVDPVSGNLYLGFRYPKGGSGETLTTWRLTTGGAPVSPAPLLSSSPSAVPEPLAVEAVAVDAEGNFYGSVDPIAENTGSPSKQPLLLELDSSAEPVASCCAAPGETLNALATNIVTAAGASDTYVLHEGTGKAFVEVLGPGPDKWPPPVVPPTIESQYPSEVGETSAELSAEINPNFWTDTRYYLEYGPAPCSGGCQKAPLPPGSLLTSEIVKRPVTTEPIEVTGLEPGATYHFRFIAESGGGGPVFGEDTTFTTFAEEGTQPPCVNDPFRGGPGARLADCRAYEMVSPVDKSGGDILVQGNIQSFPSRLDQAAPSGEAITYSSYRSFGDNESAPYTSQYLANRGASGWSSAGISPPITPPPLIGNGLDSQYQGFSEDLSSGWLFHVYAPTLAPGAIAGRPNLYRRDNAVGSFEALTTTAPIGVLEEGPDVELDGVSADGTRTVFTAKAKLTANASADPSLFQTYEAFKGNVRLVSVKPEGSPSAVSSIAGSVEGPGSIGLARGTNTSHAVSDDGTKVYWSETTGAERIYVRVNAVKTVAASTGAAKFWAAKPDGSQAIYTEGGALKRFTLATESSSTLVGEGVQGVMGASEDLTRIYVVSTAALGGGAEAGKPNLYLYEEGEPLEFVATFGPLDFLPVPALSPVTLVPWRRAARVSPDGAVAVFMSRAALTGADNTDQVSGEADAEVFHYEAATGELRCVSCSPTGTRPRGTEFLPKSGKSNYWYASRIPAWEFKLHAPRVLSTDGNRVFFNSLNRLVPADVNEAEDVYEWEALGTGPEPGGCTEEAPGFNATAGGCVTLISSGEDERDSEFVDASADGRDAFFLTGESLVDWDPGQVDLYDAREGGGLPAPPPARGPECEGEACQPQVAPPPPPSNASQGFFGPGNPAFKAPCRKGFVRKHGKCVRKHQAKKHKHHKKKGHKGKRRGRGARR